jgi:hypothetical protein
MLIRRRRNRERKSTCQYPAKDVTRMKPCGNPLLYGMQDIYQEVALREERKSRHIFTPGKERKSRRSLRRNSEARWEPGDQAGPSNTATDVAAVKDQVTKPCHFMALAAMAALATCNWQQKIFMTLAQNLP